MSSGADTKVKQDEESGLVELIRLVVMIFSLVFVTRVILFQPFNIPSGSMISTLLVGDYLFVSKYSYGWSKHSIPWSPELFSGRIWGAEPKRGDVVVFKYPSDNTTDYIKRLIGLPGDRIQVTDGVLHINGKAVELQRIEDFSGPASTCNTDRPSPIKVDRYIETLPNGVKHEVLDCVSGSEGDNTKEFVVPPGYYFMMGDNRDNSADSRFRGVGFVPRENLVGRAEIIFLSMHEDANRYQFWLWPVQVRWERLFNIIR